MVLDRLRKYELFANPAKCQFMVKEVEFLGFIIGVNGISMDPSRVSTIRDWPAPRTFRELQVFLGFANFYRRFVEGYAKVTVPLSDLLKGSEKGKKPGPFEFPERARKAFDSIKVAFTSAPMLVHYNPAMPTTVETDASGHGVSAILTQPLETGDVGKTALRHPVAFWSRKMTPAEMNYETHDQELLAIVMAFK